MQLGETIATYDVDLALRGESGKFEVTSPMGETYHVTCKPEHAASKSTWSSDQTYPQAFLIKKIAETIALDQEKGMNPAMAEAGSTAGPHTPFLLENRESKPLSTTEPSQSSMQTSSDGDRDSVVEIWNFDLLYLESDVKTKQPSASLCMKGARSGDGRTEKVMTCSCANFNELDAEIRRLQAQLEEVRSQAKKQFYKAYAAASA